jgi:hypothetical protein
VGREWQRQRHVSSRRSQGGGGGHGGRLAPRARPELGACDPHPHRDDHAHARGGRAPVLTEPEQPSAQEKEEDPFEELRAEIADFGDYDERALDVYQTLSYYFALRRQGMPRPGAKTQTCAMFGHDAPRGMCLRCGIGVDLTADRGKRERERLAERDTWLASRW